MERRRMSEFDRQHVRSSGIPSQTQPTYESTRLTRAHDMAALERGGRVIFPENRCEKKMVMHVPGYHMMKKDHVFIQFSHDVEVAAAELHRRRMPPPPVPINSNGTTWTEEEHRLFLLGHKRYSMGDWRNISRSHFVASTSTTPAQNVLMQRDVFFTDSGLVQLPTYPNHMEVPEAPAAEVHRRMPPPPPVKKGTPWTVEEHRLFLDGLEIYGKGDWKSISRYCVVSRTSTQVASHAQKFFIRQEAPKKERKRKSIHDITIGNYHNWVPLPDVATQQLQELQQAQELKQAQESRQAQEMFHPNPPNNSPEAGPSNDGFGKFEF